MARLDRNDGPNPKYAVINLRKHPEALALLKEKGWLDTDPHFVLKLRDMGAADALMSYAERYERRDPEYATDVAALAQESLDRTDRKWAD